MTRYRESFGEDDYQDYYCYDEDEVYDDLDDIYCYVPAYLVHYDAVSGKWSCTCSAYVQGGKCKHTQRMRRQVTIKVKSRYL